MYLQPLSFYFNSKKSFKKLKKAQNLENGEFYEKSAWNKKDVKFDFTSNVFIKFPVSSTILYEYGFWAAILDWAVRPPGSRFISVKQVFGNLIPIPITMQNARNCLCCAELS